MAVEGTEIDTMIGIATGREESREAGAHQGEAAVHQGEREAQATAVVHLPDETMVVEGDAGAQATQVTAGAGVAARAEIAAVEGDR